ncbi:aspartyl-trna synthetase [Palleronia sediminis]|uniref:Aspartyl-trna synthetase n=1 Tax=Palleronia sediminis TaxID=2547833 RepID=A0A4R5ZXU3_9RHOB|nr:SH3 domain-containing protein [Palleronia sediminis]TDL75095.1 aspartyl-trna synthetase [Palleronia sediminis]
MSILSRGAVCLAAIILFWTNLAWAQDVRGPVTNLPLPRYVSLKAAEGNVRRGPSLSHRIDWIYRARDLPLKITAEYGHWRRVQDRDGQGGWVHYALLSGVRTVMVDADELALRARPDMGASAVAMARRGALARVEECTRDWCEIRHEGAGGWAPKTALWGVGRDEVVN